ncbi:MAG: 50S ribosomal protein L10 [Candidatus ainarchaeum sp.]|nr:50S ribosomal protein L10 [Candidatus ainarchaeum sp.]
MTSHIRKWKEVKKEEIIGLVKEYPFVAVATLDGLPANILSVLRKKLFVDAKIIVAKTRVVQLAFKESGVDTKKLDSTVKESIAIIFSKKNPFELFSFIKKNKGETTAKEGDIAEQDIIIQAGDTGLPPGPALSTLKGVGLKVMVQGPTISIVTDKVVVKKGEPISLQLADVLSKLNMKPMHIGMSILGVFDKLDNEFYSAQVLDVDEEELFNKFVLAYRQALNLSVNAQYFNSDSAELIVIKAQREANAINAIIGNTSDKSNESNTNDSVIDEIAEQAAIITENDVSEENNIVEEIASQAVDNTSDSEVKEN